MYIAIDIGGTNTKVAAFEDLQGEIPRSFSEYKTNQEYKRGVANLVSSIKGIARQPIAIGISFAGGVSNKETVIGSTNLPDWINKPLVADLNSIFNCPVVIENDALLGALGEAANLKEAEDFIYIAWGTGLGAAIVEYQDGLPHAYRSENRSLLYEIEENVGGLAIERRFSKLPEELSDTEWEKVFNDLIAGMERLSLSPDWGKKKFVIGGGIADKKAQEIIKLSVNEIEIRICSLGSLSSLHGCLTLIEQIN